MTRTLFAVTSYFPDAVRGCHQAIRDGWGQDVHAIGADLRFFVPTLSRHKPPKSGFAEIDFGLYEQQPDEVFLEIDSAYNNITRQVWEILKFSLLHDYDRVFLACNDTFVFPQRVLADLDCDYSGEFYPPWVSLGETFDWSWYEEKIPNVFSWAGAGTGIFLSKKAAEAIVEDEPSRWITEHSFYGFAYDVWIGQCLGGMIRSGEIAARNTKGVSHHYEHLAGEQRYAGVCEWQRETYKRKRATPEEPPVVLQSLPVTTNINRV